MEVLGVGGSCIFTGGRIYVRMYIHTYSCTHTHVCTCMWWPSLSVIVYSTYLHCTYSTVGLHFNLSKSE